MTDAVDSMAYAGETPWHGLGNKVANNLSPKEICKAAGLNWEVEKRKLQYADKHGKMVDSDKFALVRKDTDVQLTTVGQTWKPVQNDQAMDFFKKFTQAGHMKMETAGSLWDGRYVWGLARVGKDFKLGKNDEVQNFLLLCSPHVHGKALVIQFTPIRVVCWNTLSFALGADLRGKGGTTFSMPHSSVFNDATKLAAESALGIAKESVEQFQEAATILSKTKATKEAVENFFHEVLDHDPKEAGKKKDGEAKAPRMLPKFQHALTHAPGQALNTAEGTWWGALNAVTYVIDHESGKTRDTALKNAWLGHLSTVKRRAFDLAIKAASSSKKTTK